MDDHAVGSDCSEKSKSIAKERHLCIVVEAAPVNSMYKRRKHNHHMSNPPKELLMLNHALQTLLQWLLCGAGRDGTGRCSRSWSGG